MTNGKFNKNLALYLLKICKLTYDQFDHDGSFSIPNNAKVLKVFKAKSFDSLEWFGFILEKDDSVITAFRGTDSDPDWISDAEVFQSSFPYSTDKKLLVHDGFLSIYQSCRDEILKSYSTVSKNNKKLFITGHSLGAAIATLHALDTAMNTDFKDVNVINFASPRVGNQEFANNYNQLINKSTRFVNQDDIIPLLPPEKIQCPFTKKDWKYSHVDSPLNFRIQTGSLAGNHALTTYKEGVKLLD
ncbi:lipase family protein [Litchfieldia alkalitelluris]|uniref:lipase family protein n=1 Tax=Litchfieldia alkalitelluris TaxID=304268 RepID=UPI0009984491|nr:lipase family protein [Litchfieldia alkalitelluris]